MGKILDVKDLRISFRTSNGTVKAVRNINFHLNKGETLAIVGESGSGKSVTSRAIMGILAGNAIVESGEIIYDGQDLLKIPEEDMHFLRGEKLSMIFQDPLSSLNPIIKIGRQLTEAMIIKGKMRQKKMRALFNYKLGLLLKFMDIATNAEADKTLKEANGARTKTFDDLAIKQVTLENAYNIAHDAVVETIDDIKDLVFEIEKKAANNAIKRIQYIVNNALKTIHEYVVKDDAEKLTALCAGIETEISSAKKSKSYEVFIEPLKNICTILEKSRPFAKPDFFAISYYTTFVNPVVPVMPVTELNAYLNEQLHSGFMTEFISYTEKALQCAFEKSQAAKKETVLKLKEALEFFNKPLPEKPLVFEYVKGLIAQVDESINRLDIIKDSLEYTFKSSLSDAVKRYFSALKNNLSENTRYDKEMARYNSKKAKGIIPDWEVVPANILDVEVIRSETVQIISKLIDNFEQDFETAKNFNSADEAQKLIVFFKETASAVVHKVTKEMAKHRALKIMEEVGISEPRKRFNQYPFQFSGGMRQRIVIAIALSVLPDILICDEPTTALDVTIQSQILELINGLKAKHNLSVIFITHDLGVVANMADRVAVMYAGKIVEYGTAEDIFYSPAHPYTWALLSSMPDLETKEKLEAIPGVPPNMIFPPKGDAFAARNKYAMKIDFEQEPPFFKISDTHYAATWLLHPDAPKVEMPRIVKERILRNKKHFEDLQKELTGVETQQAAVKVEAATETVAKLNSKEKKPAKKAPSKGGTNNG